MSINIKEIFQSDNLSLSQDKINYNFDQILANGGGPQGLKGDKGITGALGSIGPKGDKGNDGDAGPKGDTGASGYWDLKSYISPIDQHTLLPKIQPTAGSTTGAKPTNIVLGRTDGSYAENATDKLSLITLVSENNGADWTDLVRLRLWNGSAYNATSGVIRLTPITGGSKLKIAAIDGTNILELQSKQTIISDDTNAIKLKITSANTEASATWNFLNDVNIDALGSLTNNGITSLLNNNTIGAVGKFNNIIGGTNIYGDFLKIKPTGTTPVLNKLLVAQDTNGTVAWKNPTEVMGMYPIGTIVFVNPAEISDTYFSISSYSFPGSGQTASSSYKYFGRGLSTGRWAGWYLLMGQTNAWYATSSLLYYVPTNVPGSILIGASAPDDAVGVSDDIFDSSMGIKMFNPLTPGGSTNGYGAGYQPQLRGTYNGVGAQGAVNTPRDLTNFLSGDGTKYDALEVASLNADPLFNSTLDGNVAYPDQLSFMPMPMAVYLGRTDLVYNYATISVTPKGS